MQKESITLNGDDFMKSRRYLTPLLVFLLAVLAGCNPCKDVDCVHGSCASGDCICQTGYGTNDCSVAHNSKLSGVYRIDEECSFTGNDFYRVLLTPVPGAPDKVGMDSLYRTLTRITGVLTDGGNTIDIPNIIVDGGSIESVGPGTVSSDGSTFTLHYQFISTGQEESESCQATLTRL